MSIPSENQKIVAIVGPTASGKTALALELARERNGEIVSADSRQIYRGMDIGTSKPSAADRASVPHHLIDIKKPDEDYAVAEYKRDAIAAIQDILRRGGLPILVGGTGLYVKAVVENLDIPAVKADPELRKKIENEIQTEGLDVVFKKLAGLDPEAAYVVDPKNPRRVVRALEVALSTGKPFTAQRKKNEPLFEVLEIGLDLPPVALRERIDKRIDHMMEIGLLEEVRRLTERYGYDCPAFDAIGYREIIDHIRNGVPLEKTVADMKINTWHYAKRQLTWFKKDRAVVWISDPYEVQSHVATFVKKERSIQ